MKANRLLALTATAAVLCIGASQTLAQNEGGDRPRRNQGGGGGGGNFDPAEFQARFLERTRERLEITDDAEWKAVEGLVIKVNEARQAVGGGRFGRGGRGGGGGGGGQGGGGFGPPPSAEEEALQKAIDSKASAAELKAALAKYQEARKAKHFAWSDQW